MADGHSRRRRVHHANHEVNLPERNSLRIARNPDAARRRPKPGSAFAGTKPGYRLILSIIAASIRSSTILFAIGRRAAFQRSKRYNAALGLHRLDGWNRVAVADQGDHPINAVLCRQERHVHAKHHVDALKIGFPLSAVPWNCSLQSRTRKRGMRLMAPMNRRLALKRSCCGRWITGKLCNEATHLGVLPPARASPCGLRRGLVAKASAHIAVSARRAFREDGGAAPTAPPE